MATLQKKHAVKVFADILCEVFIDNKESFPIKFDDFGYEVAKKLYSRFKYIEGNPIIFERTMGLDALPIEMKNSFELVDNIEDVNCTMTDYRNAFKETT